MTRYHLSPTDTSERDMTAGLGWFYRFHVDPEGLYIPYALRSVDCQVTTEGKAPVLHRCVREVIKFHGVKEVAWKLITWVPGLPGVQIQPYGTEACQVHQGHSGADVWLTSPGRQLEPLNSNSAVWTSIGRQLGASVDVRAGVNVGAN